MYVAACHKISLFITVANIFIIVVKATDKQVFFEHQTVRLHFILVYCNDSHNMIIIQNILPVNCMLVFSAVNPAVEIAIKLFSFKNSTVFN